MTRMTRDDMEVPFFWIGIDSSGSLARFSTGGEAVIPHPLRSSLEDIEMVTDFFVELQLHVDSWKLTDGTFDPAYVSHDGPLQSMGSKYLTSYIEGAERIAATGFYVYSYIQSGSWGVGYYRVASPGRPRQLDSLPTDVQRIVNRCTFRTAHFKDLFEITPEMVAQI